MNDSNEWKARIYEEPMNGNFKIYIISDSPGNIRGYVSNAHTGEISYLKEGEDMISHSMVLTQGMMQALFTALQGQGMKPVEQSYVEGKLEATEKHLEDMRTLSKLTGKIHD